MALQWAIDSDPGRPQIIWTGDAPHRWFDMDIPWGSYGFNNQDDIYRMMPIEPAGRYEIAGGRSSHREQRDGGDILLAPHWASR